MNLKNVTNTGNATSQNAFAAKDPRVEGIAREVTGNYRYTQGYKRNSGMLSEEEIASIRVVARPTPEEIQNAKEFLKGSPLCLDFSENEVEVAARIIKALGNNRSSDVKNEIFVSSEVKLLTQYNLLEN